MKQFFSSYHVILFLSFIFLLTACAPKTPTADVHNIKVQDEELKALKGLYSEYHKMDGIDITLFLQHQDLSELINNSFTEFSQNFSDLNSSEFSNVSLSTMQFYTSVQTLHSKFSFSFELKNSSQKVFGHIKAKHTFRAGVNQFVLDTKFNDIVLDKIEPIQENDKGSEKISLAIQSFVQSLNVEIINQPLQIEVDMNILSAIDENSIYYADDYAMHWVQPITMKSKMKIFVPYLSKRGLLFLGSSTLKKQEHLLNDDSSKLATILKDLINDDLARNMGVNLDLVQKYSSYYISKKYLSTQMSHALKEIDMRVINKFLINIDEVDQNISKNIYFFDKERLPSCQGLKIDCKTKLASCEKNCPLKYGIQNCALCEKINNPFEKVICLSTVEACRSKQEKHLYTCHKRENACVAKNGEDEKICEIENVKNISICREKKDDLEFINDEIVLAKLNLNFKTPSSYVVQRLRRISFSEQLDKLEVTRDLHLSMESEISTSMQYSQYEDLNCSYGLEEPLLVHSEYDFVNQKQELPLLNQTLSDGRLMLTARRKPTFISARLKNVPFEKLMKDKKFALECQYQTMPMQKITGDMLLKKKEIPYALNPMLAEIELPFKEEELSFIISPIKLGSNISLFPTLEQKSIGFSRQAHFY